MKKILYLPSWYPATGNAIAGSFFREQAELSQENYDVKVIAVHARELKPGKLLRAAISKGGLSEPVSTDEVSPPESIGFRYLLPRKKSQGALTYHTQLQFLSSVVGQLVEQGWSPDVIHAHSLFGPGIFVHALATRFGARSVLTEHDSFNMHRLSLYHQKKALGLIRDVDRLACVSQHLANILAAHGASRPVQICGNWIDETAFAIGAPSTDPVLRVLHVSYPSPIKGTDLLFQAAARIPLAMRNLFRFTLVSGSESNRLYFQSIVDQLGIADLFCIKGCVDRKDMPAEYSGHNCYVCTSYSETFGVAMREALMSGIPVVTTACGGIDSDIDASNGLIVPTGDPVALCNALLLMQQNRQMYDAAKLREQCLSRYGRKAFLAKLTALYED